MFRREKKKEKKNTISFITQPKFLSTSSSPSYLPEAIPWVLEIQFFQRDVQERPGQLGCQHVSN